MPSRLSAGLAGGIGIRQQQALKQQADQEQQSKQIELKTKQSERANKAITDVLTMAGELSKAFQSGQTRMTPEQYQEQINNFVNVALRTATLGSEAGLEVMSPDLLESQRQALLSSPTMEQSAAAEGRAAVAKAGGVAEATGASREEVLQAGGVLPKPETPQTDIGKTIFDQELVEKQFGQDSPQAKAFRDLLSSKQKGETFKLSDVSGLRKEFTQQSGDFVKVRDAYGKVELAAKNPSAAGDLSLIFNFMKMLDPGSTVREGEFANAQNAAGIPARVTNIYNRLLNGERLGQEQRQDFLSTSNNVMRSQLRFQKQLERQYKGIAQRQEMPSDDVVVDFIGEYRDAKRSPIVQMSKEELIALTTEEIEKMSPDELKALDKRMKDVGL